MIFATWEASHTIAVIGLCTTALVGIAGIVTGHIREKRLHSQQLESDRAHALRERSLDVAYQAFDIASDLDALAQAPQPTSIDEVSIALRRSQPAFGKQVVAHQEAQRLATLGWSPAVRSAAKHLADALLSAGVSIQFPKLVISAGLPEATSIAAGDPGFWTRHQNGIGTDAEALRAASKEFLEAIEP